MLTYYWHAMRSRQGWPGAGAVVIGNSILRMRIVPLSSSIHNLHAYSWPRNTYSPNLHTICMLQCLCLHLSWWVKKDDWGASRGWTLNPVCTLSKRAKNLLPLKTGKFWFLSRAVHSVYTLTTELTKTVPYNGIIYSRFLGAFVKLREATISLVMSVRLSIRTEQLGSYWTDYNEIWYLNIFRKSVDKTRISFKSDKNNGYFTWGAM